MSWPRVALRTMPYPDRTVVGLGVEWADMGATHCPSQPMILRPNLVILRAPSQMEYAIRHLVVFNSKAYANI